MGVAFCGWFWRRSVPTPDYAAEFLAPVIARSSVVYVFCVVVLPPNHAHNDDLQYDAATEGPESWRVGEWASGRVGGRAARHLANAWKSWSMGSAEPGCGIASLLWGQSCSMYVWTCSLLRVEPARPVEADLLWEDLRLDEGPITGWPCGSRSHAGPVSPLCKSSSDLAATLDSLSLCLCLR
jgi:hypothetical protein